MPNGDHPGDRNASRINIVLRQYRARFGTWPTTLMINNEYLADAAKFIGEAGLAALRTKVTVEVTVEPDEWPDTAIRVSGPEGALKYGDVDRGLKDDFDVRGWIGPDWPM